MATMGKYCKAYLVKEFRQFDQWTEDITALHTSSSASSSEASDETPEKQNFDDNDVLYLQENYVVTNGIFQDEQIVFDRVTPEWQEFCHTVLKFEVPSFETVQ